MTLLLLVWTVSLLLIGSALAVVAGLLLVRGVRAVRTRVSNRLRKRLLPILLAVSETGDLDTGAEAELRRHPAVVAELASELFELVRGGSLNRLVMRLRAIGLVEHLGRRALRGNENRRVHALECLPFFPEEDVRQFLDHAFGDRSARVRIAAALALVQIGRAPPVRVLVERLGEVGEQGSARIVEIFAKLPRDRRDELLDIAAEHVRPAWVRAAAVRALAGSGDYALVPQFQDLARSAEKPALVAECVRAIGLLAHPAGTGAVRWALEHADWQVRAEACEAAGRIGLSDSGAVLGQLLDDEVWLVRFQAGRALAALGHKGHSVLQELANRGEGQSQRTAALILAERGLA